jgi:hypothetical protein
MESKKDGSSHDFLILCVVNLIFLKLDFWIQMRKGMVWTTHKNKHNVTRTQTFCDQGHCQFVVLFLLFKFCVETNK